VTAEETPVTPATYDAVSILSAPKGTALLEWKGKLLPVYVYAPGQWWATGADFVARPAPRAEEIIAAARSSSAPESTTKSRPRRRPR